MTDHDDDFDWDAIHDQIKNVSVEDLLTNAWKSEALDSASGLASQRALRALSADSPELTNLVATLGGPIRDKLDLRLSGRKIYDHSTNAAKLADFMKKVSKAFNEIAKSANGLIRIQDRILATGPGNGSVRVIFTVEPSPISRNELAIMATGTREERAIRALVSLWLQAEDLESDVLDSSIHSLHGGAQRSVHALTKLISETDWNVEGELVSRQGERVPIKLSQRGLKRVLDITSHTESETSKRTFIGYIDGWTWSKQTMRFNSIEGERAIDALVPEELSQTVAEWMPRHETKVKVVFNILKTFPTGDQEYARNSYTLNSLEPANDQDELPTS